MLTGNSEKKVEGFEKYEIESAARTLIEAEEIRINKKLFPLAEKEVKRQRDAANAVLSDKQIEDRTSKRLKKTFGD